MATPHIGAKKGQIAKTVLMPGDPLRAKYIAEKFLENPVCYNTTRNMFGYTGTYKGKEISIQGSGMGMPSIGIYSYELFTQYDVENIIRIGSCGSFQEDVKVRDVILGVAASTDSNYAASYNLPGTFAPMAHMDLVTKAIEIAKEKNIAMKCGNILSSDVFYGDDPDGWKAWQKMGVMAVEMEAAALYLNAARLGKKALCILTVSDSLVTHELVDAEAREKTFTDMMEIALELA